eukprot:2339859-Amphidinium_carterae.1
MIQVMKVEDAGLLREGGELPYSTKTRLSTLVLDRSQATWRSHLRQQRSAWWAQDCPSSLLAHSLAPFFRQFALPGFLDSGVRSSPQVEQFLPRLHLLGFGQSA